MVFNGLFKSVDPYFIGKLESVNEDWGKLIKKIAFPEILHYNSTRKKELELTPSQIAKINERYGSDFSLFNYKKD